MINILALALFQLAGISSGATQVSPAPQAPATTISISLNSAALGGVGGWGGDIASAGGVGGWGGDIAAMGGVGGWGGDIASAGGVGGWGGDITA